MKIVTGLLLAPLLGACSPATGPVDEAPTPAEATSAPAPAPAVELAGEWRVAGIDGEEIDKPYAVTLSADAARIWWEPTCAGQGRDYAIDGSRFTSEPPRPGPQEVCAIGPPVELAQIWAVLDAADRIERTPENGVLISGTGGSVLLFSQ